MQGHKVTIVAADATPTEPLEVECVDVNLGQRCDNRFAMRRDQNAMVAADGFCLASACLRTGPSGCVQWACL
jgi:Multicopper oxidase